MEQELALVAASTQVAGLPERAAVAAPLEGLELLALESVLVQVAEFPVAAVAARIGGRGVAWWEATE